MISIELIPAQSAELKHIRAQEDKYCYKQGKRDAQEGLDRRGEELYHLSRDIDCYNMGYTYESSGL